MTDYYIGYCDACLNWRRLQKCFLDSLEERAICDECLGKIVISKTIPVQYGPPEKRVNN